MVLRTTPEHGGGKPAMTAAESAALLRLAARLTGLPLVLLLSIEDGCVRILDGNVEVSGCGPKFASMLQALVEERRSGLIRAADAGDACGRAGDRSLALLRDSGFDSAVVAPLAGSESTPPAMLCCLAPRGVVPRGGAFEALADLSELVAETLRSHRAMLEVLASESCLRTAIDALPLALWIADAKGRCIVQNAADRTCFGDWVGLCVEDGRLPPDLPDRQRSKAGGEAFHFAVTRQIDDREVVLEQHVAPLLVDGEAVGRVGLAIDVTAGIRIERQLVESEARLRAAVDALPFPFFICDLDGRHILQNVKDRDAWGDGVGKTFAELGLPDQVVHGLTEAIPRIRAGRTWRKLVCYEEDGRLRHVEEVYAPVQAKGSVCGFVGLAIDHTEHVEAERRLQASDRRLRDYLATASDWHWETDAAHRFVRRTGEPRRSGLALEELLGETLPELVEEGCEGIGGGEASAAAGLARYRPFRDRLVSRADATGRPVWIEVSGNPLFDSAGRPAGYRGTARDVTGRIMAEAALREAHARLEALATSGLIGITAGRGWRVEEANDAFLKMVGRDRAELAQGAIDWRELTVDPPAHPIDMPAARPDTAAVAAIEQELLRGDGTPVTVLLNRILLDEKDQHWLALVQDLTLVKAAEQRIRLLAERDGLTGLANRRVLLERLQGDLDDRRRPGGLGALMMLDLDRFKEVNDRLGHAAGDALLRTIGERLTSVLRDTDTVARLGGDEFAMVLRELRGPADVAEIAAKLLLVLGRPIELEGHVLRPRCSIGISLFPRDGHDVARLLKNADLALYQAKARGRGRFRFFEPALLEALERRRAIGEALQADMAGEAFEIELQPQIHLSSGCHAGFEALVRWRRDGELVAPGEFIDIAEEIGVIEALGRLVLRRALEALRHCDDLGLDPGHVAVNVAAAQLRAPGFPGEVAALLAELDLESHRLEVEVTENVLLDRDAGAIARSLCELHQLGVTITLDDFGTGAASLAHLKSLPVDRLKIDRSFVGGIGQDADDAVIVRTIINLAHTLGMTVVAEGVETAEQETFLELHACDLAQGFRFARPLAVHRLAAHLAPTGVLVS